MVSKIGAKEFKIRGLKRKWRILQMAKYTLTERKFYDVDKLPKNINNVSYYAKRLGIFIEELQYKTLKERKSANKIK